MATWSQTDRGKGLGQDYLYTYDRNNNAGGYTQKKKISLNKLWAVIWSKNPTEMCKITGLFIPVQY